MLFFADSEIKDSEVEKLQNMATKLAKKESDRTGYFIHLQSTVAVKSLGDFHKRIQNIRFHLSSRGHVIKTEEHVSKIGGKKDMAGLKVFDMIEKRFC